MPDPHSHDDGSVDRAPREFANGVGELIDVTRNGSAFAFTRGGVATNLGERTAEMQQKYTDIGGHCERYQGLTDFKSIEGVPRVDVTTGPQSGSATYNSTTQRYVWTGFRQGAIFGMEKVNFTFGGASVALDPPADYGTPEETLSQPAGLDTKVSIADGEFDAFTLFGQLTAGEAFSCLFRVAELTLEGSRRTSAVVPAEVRAAIPDVDGRLDTLYIGKATEASTTMLFPSVGPRNLHAARLLKIRAAALRP